MLRCECFTIDASRRSETGRSATARKPGMWAGVLAGSPGSLSRAITELGVSSYTSVVRGSRGGTNHGFHCGLRTAIAGLGRAPHLLRCKREAAKDFC